jgi:adenine deaminase
MGNAVGSSAQQGGALCDLNLVNCTVIDVFTGRFLPHSTISIRNGKIAGINDNLEARQTEDLGGAYVAPGLIDAHVHIESSLLPPCEYARIVLPHGTTTVIADPHEIVNVLGYDGMRYMLNASQDLPLDVFFMIPSCVPATDFDSAGASFYASDMYPFLQDTRVLGLGEVMNYPGVLRHDPSLLDKIALFRNAGKPIDGHAPGLNGADLSAYIAEGIGSDHECTTPAEALEKVSKGMYVMLREGSTARDLGQLLPAVTPESATRFMFCSDDRHSNDLRDEGHIDYCLRLSLKNGMDPITAFRIACMNAPAWFGIKDLGAIRPGYKADFVCFSSLDDFHVEKVYKNGKVVAENGQLTVEVPKLAPPIRDSVNIKWLTSDDFIIPDKGKKVRVIEARPDSILTENRIVEPLVKNGVCVSDLERDILKLFVIERHTGSGNIGKGFISGLGLKRGALGSTISHDSHNMIIAGVDDVSIFKAARHLNKIKGGLVFTIGDQVVLDLPLPIAGLMSDKDADFVIERLKAFDMVYHEEGMRNPEPLMALSFMALPVIPKLKLTDRGLVDVEHFTTVDLYVDD